MNANKEIHIIFMKKVFILIFLSSWLSVCSGFSLTYNDILSLGATCSPFDTCSKPRALEEDNLSSQNCECKRSCIRYGTCCIDSPFIVQYQRQLKIPPAETCEFMPGAPFAVFAKSKCKEDGQHDKEIKALCENQIIGLKDPLTTVPVTNPRTSTTYKNYFCAMCNDDINDLVFWNIAIRTPERTPDLYNDRNNDKDSLVQGLIYDDKTNQWGILSDAPTSDGHLQGTAFKPVILTLDYPPRLQGSITRCESDLVSNCHRSWRNKSVKNKCLSYMGMIYGLGNTTQGTSGVKRFRNIHCALCNSADLLSRKHCKGGTDTVIDKPGLSFALLLDINLNGGTRVGEVERCESGEVFDPFFKKCRVMKCVKPGYVLRRRKCEAP